MAEEQEEDEGVPVQDEEDEGMERGSEDLDMGSMPTEEQLPGLTKAKHQKYGQQ